MNRGLRYTFLITLVFTTAVFAGNKIDSLHKVVLNTSNDTLRLKALNTLCREYYYAGNNDSAIYCAKEAQQLADRLSADFKRSKLTIERERANAYRNLGDVYVGEGNFPEALRNDTIALNIAKQAGDKKTIADAYGNIGGVYTCAGSYVEALNNELNALRLDEETGNKRGMISAYTNIGNIYRAEHNYDEALKNHLKCLAVSQEIGFKQGMTWAYNNMGDIYEEQGNHDEALKDYKACLEVSKEISYREGTAASYANMGMIYLGQNKYDEALNNELAAKKIYDAMGANQYIANADAYLGEVFLKQNKFDEALKNLNSGLTISIKSGYKEIAKQIYLDLSNLYETLAKEGKLTALNWQKAHENFKNYVSYNDSLFNEATRKKSEQAQMQFEFDKKEAVAKAEQDKKDALHKEERQKQAAILDSLVVGIILLMALAFFIFRGYKLKQKANIIISHQKDLVEQKNHIIEGKNKSITDSINYARLIQSAMLAPEDEINKTLAEYFILFKPKDIVSGDFYFYKKAIAGDKLYLAVCDCTGHGVPGAFMSLIGNEKLTDAVEQHGEPGTILKQLNRSIKLSLHQSHTVDSMRDGMDIALCCIHTNNENNRAVIKFSGANRPLWINRKGEHTIEEIKPTKKSIGGFTEEGTEFESHDITLQKGDCIYIFTDGFADQFGGTEGKKLTTKRFRGFIHTVMNKAMNEQKTLLTNFMNEWMGNNEQVDDILVIGVRI